MPKSTIRKKKVYTPPPEARPASEGTRTKPSPPWLPASAVALIVFGIGWLVVFYITTAEYPVQSWGYWNLAVGFGAMIASLPILSKWR